MCVERLPCGRAFARLTRSFVQAPRCKFSRRMVDLLNAEGVEFGSFDILSDPEVRAAIKDYAKWPTFPMCVLRQCPLRALSGR